jgi:hypothetical protein
LSRIAVVLLGVALAGRSAAQAPAPKRTTVTAVTAGLVYVGAGRVDGLVEGSLVQVLRLGEQGHFRVRFISSHSAACGADSATALPAIGDTVEFQPVAATPAEVTTTAARYSATSAAGRRRSPALRGRIGVRYLASTDHGSGLDLRQPGFELSLSGPIVAGAPVGMSVDVRSRRTSLYRPGEPAVADGTMGVYQAALRFQSAAGPVRAIVGRQYAPTLAGVGLFDGILLDYQHGRWGGGVLAGLAPELGSLAFSSTIRQFGAYLQGHNELGAHTRWSLTAGAMGSYYQSDINREFGFLQATVASPTVSAIVLQEVDLNRSWKIAAGEPRFSFTSTYASVSVTPARWVALTGGIDNRRNVRLYQDLVTPEQVFDARFRLGLWSGVSFAVGSKLRFGGDIRSSEIDGADSLRTAAYSANLSLDRLTTAGLGLRLRWTRYETPGRGPGQLSAATIRLAPRAIGAIELTGGQRREPGGVLLDRSWLGATLELAVRRSWFGLASITREWGPDGATAATDLLYAGLSYRF